MGERLKDGGAADLLEALIVAIQTWEKFYERIPYSPDVEDAEFEEMLEARAAVCRAMGIMSWGFHAMLAARETTPTPTQGD